MRIPEIPVFVLLDDSANYLAVNLNRDGPLKNVDGEYDAGLVFRPYDEAFHPGERSTINRDAFPLRKIWPRLHV
jgi:hypothetical protein